MSWYQNVAAVIFYPLDSTPASIESVLVEYDEFFLINLIKFSFYIIKKK